MGRTLTSSSQGAGHKSKLKLEERKWKKTFYTSRYKEKYFIKLTHAQTFQY
jgi:hypothetical protein